VRDAFAPISVMLDFWRERQPVGRLLNVDVSLINDLYENWRGEIWLLQLRGDAPVVEQVQPAEVPALGASRRTFVIPLPDEPGAYRLEAALPDSPRGPVRSLRDLRLVSAAQFDAEENLAFQCNATASSWQIWEGRALEAGLAVDGVEETHWSSRLGASHWLAVDLGRTCRVSRATIIWGRSCPGSCALDVGPDGRTWTEVHRVESCSNEADRLEFGSTEARWVRLRCTPRQPGGRVDVRELEVYR